MEQPVEKKCSKCGRSDVRIIGHHPDYSKPHDVIPLCDSCHCRVHADGEGPSRPRGRTFKSALPWNRHVTISVTLTHEEVAALRKEAAERTVALNRRVSMSDIMREALGSIIASI